MRIVVIGANGQLGRDLVPRLPGEAIPLNRNQLDLDRPDSIAECLRSLKPNAVVNCAAYNFVDKAEADPEPAFRSNAWGVRELAKVCSELDAKLVHFSTDYVFGLDSKRTQPLGESARPGPVSVYGASKLLGEYFALAAPGALVLRTCGLYGLAGTGGKGGNFVETMLRLAGTGKPIRVVNDQRNTPTSTADLAERTAELIRDGEVGLRHVTNSGDCTWYEFAREIFRVAGVRPELIPITTAEFGASARRPAYSAMASESGPMLQPWKQALADYLERRKARR